MPYTNPVDLYHNKPKTKIVCTSGPSSDSEEVLRELVETGMNVNKVAKSLHISKLLKGEVPTEV